MTAFPFSLSSVLIIRRVEFSSSLSGAAEDEGNGLDLEGEGRFSEALGGDWGVSTTSSSLEGGSSSSSSSSESCCRLTRAPSYLGS